MQARAPASKFAVTTVSTLPAAVWRGGTGEAESEPDHRSFTFPETLLSDQHLAGVRHACAGAQLVLFNLFSLVRAALEGTLADWQCLT